MKNVASYTRKILHIQFMDCEMYIPALKQKIKDSKTNDTYNEK